MKNKESEAQEFVWGGQIQGFCFSYGHLYNSHLCIAKFHIYNFAALVLDLVKDTLKQELSLNWELRCFKVKQEQ